MPLPHKTKITTALGRAAKAGVRRAVAGPSKQELAAAEVRRIDEQQRKARAQARAARKPKKPKRKPKTGFAGLNEALKGLRPPN